MITEIKYVLDSFAPVSLEEMDDVRLMDRNDTKYVLPASKIPDLLELMNEGYRILEINGYRISSYDTTYLDTFDRLFFNQHVTGRTGRSKVRFRTYNSTGITFLEIKRKTKKDRTVKWRIENHPDENNYNEKAKKFIRKHVFFNAEFLKPVIRNGFSRITLVGYDVPERITIDLDLSFSGNNGQYHDLPFLAVAELKSEGSASRSPFTSLIKRLSVYPSGFSKYCVGSAIIYNIPHANILKPVLLFLNKIENEYNRSVSA